MRHILSIIFVVLMAFVFSSSQSASAAIITVEVEGVVNSVETSGDLTLDGSVYVGSTMTGSCSYDTQTPDLGTGSYAMLSISVVIGNYTFTHDPMSPDLPEFRVGTLDDVYVAYSPAPRFDGTIYINGSPKIYDDITWGWTYMELFNLRTSSINLIGELPDLDSWPNLSIFDMRRKFETRLYGEGNDDFRIYGEVTSLTVIPEPATILLLGLGGIILRKKR